MEHARSRTRRCAVYTRKSSEAWRRAVRQRNSRRHHRELSRTTILRLADSLTTEEPLRKTFLSGVSVRKVLGNVADT